jgi:hypothetical protein
MNVHFMREESDQYQQQACSPDHRAPAESKQAIEDDGETKKIPLYHRVPDKVVCPDTKMAPEEEAELLAFFDKNNNAFVWSTTGLIGVSKDIIQHRLQVKPATKPRK